jgi:hypothetical protein
MTLPRRRLSDRFKQDGDNQTVGLGNPSEKVYTSGKTMRAALYTWDPQGGLD